MNLFSLYLSESFSGALMFSCSTSRFAMIGSEDQRGTPDIAADGQGLNDRYRVTVGSAVRQLWPRHGHGQGHGVFITSHTCV